MEDERKTRKQLIEELNELRKSAAKLKNCKEEINQLRSDQEIFTKAFLQNSIPTGITTLKDGRFVEVSDAFLSLMGRTRNEVIGHTSVEIGSITEQQRSLFINELSRNGRIENLEMIIKTKKGVSRHGLFNAVMMNLANEKYLLTVMTDITDRKQAQEALKKREEILSLITENMSDMIRVTDSHGVNLYASPSHLAGLGYKPEERLGKTGFDIAHPDDLPMISDEFAEGLVGKRSMKRLEYRVKHANGHYVWLDTIVNILKDDLGQVKTIVMCSRDITERKLMEKELREQKQYLNAILKTTNDAFGVFTTNGQITEVNDAMCNLLGYDRLELLKKRINDIIAEEDPDMTAERLRRVMTGESTTFESRHRRNDGSIFDVEISLSYLKLEGGIFFCFCRDITDRKRAEAALVKSEEKYRTITENMMDCVALVDEKGIFQYITNSSEILGYEPKEMISKTGLSFSHPDEKARMLKLYTGAIGKVWHEVNYETRFRHKNGQYILLEVSVRTLSDAQGKIIGAVIVARDAAQHRRMMKELFFATKPSSTSPMLSQREKEILGWIMQGKSTWDISTILKITERTVKFHVDSVMKKLSAVNRTHAVVIAMRNDLI